MKKVSTSFVVTEEFLAMMDGFSRKGHTVIDEVTPEDVAQWQAEQNALLVLQNAKWIDVYEFDYHMRPLERSHWVPEETVEEWLARYRQAKKDGWKPRSFWDDFIPWTEEPK